MKKRILAVLLSVALLLGCCAVTVGAVDVSSTGFIDTLAAVDSYMQSQSPAQREIIYNFLATYTSTDAGMDSLILYAEDQSTLDSDLIKNYIAAYGDGEVLAFYLRVLKCVPLEIRRAAVAHWHARTGFEGYDAAAAYGAGTEAIYNYLIGENTTYEQDGLSLPVFYQLLYDLRDMVVFTADRNDENFDYKFYKFTNTDFKNNLNKMVEASEILINDNTVASAEDFMAELCNIINADENITVQMKKDFAKTLVTTNSFVYSTQATKLSISTTDALTQTVGSTAPVTVTLTTQKADASADAVIEPAVEWYVNNSLVKTGGTSYTYNTPNTEGTYTIKVVSGDVKSNLITITVKKKQSSGVKPPVAGDSILGDITGSGTGSGTGTIPMPTPEVYPTIPEPSKVGFVTVNNTTKPISSVKTTFDDVQDHWAKEHVEVLATTGYVRGHSATTYAPDSGVTREEMAVILVRVLGIEGQKAAAPVAFSDHANIQDYAVDAVYRLVELGVYKGHSEGNFAPQQVLTREEISALFSRVLGRAGLTVEKDFHDHHEIADWFAEDVENLINFGVINGYPDNTFRPQGDVTRAEAAVMMYNTLHRLGILK